MTENKARKIGLTPQFLCGLVHYAEKFGEDFLGFIQRLGSHLKFLAEKPRDKKHALGKIGVVTDVQNGLYEKKLEI